MDLKNGNFKDDFLLQYISVLVDNTIKYALFSFMDGFLDLRKAGATYQRAMTALFHDMIHKEMGYVDDMVSKSRTEEDHQVNLKKVFEHLMKYDLKLNSIQCVFGATSDKLQRL